MKENINTSIKKVSLARFRSTKNHSKFEEMQTCCRTFPKLWQCVLFWFITLKNCYLKRHIVLLVHEHFKSRQPQKLWMNNKQTNNEIFLNILVHREKSMWLAQTDWARWICKTLNRISSFIHSFYSSALWMNNTSNPNCKCVCVCVSMRRCVWVDVHQIIFNAII